MSFRNELKRQLGHKLFEIKAKNPDEEAERIELAIRLMHFFKYEQDPEFEKWFSNFIVDKKITTVDNREDLFDGLDR